MGNQQSSGELPVEERYGVSSYENFLSAEVGRRQALLTRLQAHLEGDFANEGKENYSLPHSCGHSQSFGVPLSSHLFRRV